MTNLRSFMEVFARARVIAVPGCSDRPDRDSNMIAGYLISCGFTVHPVNPNLRTVLGRTCYPSLAEVPEHVDIVNVFRRPEFAADLTEQAAAIRAGLIWFQPGTASHQALIRAAELGLPVVPDACIRVVHAQVLHKLSGKHRTAG